MNEERTQPQKRPRPMLMILVSLCLALTLVLAGALVWMQIFITTPASQAGTPVVFIVSPGQSLGTIAENLNRAGLISDPLRFKIYARYKKAATLIKTGEYDLSPALSPERLLSRLVSGKVKLYRFTVPEGLNMEEIAGLAQAAGFCGSDRFLALCRDEAFIMELGLPVDTLEGYLYPDTYFFPRKTSCRSVIQKMTATFERTFSPEWQARADELGFSRYDIVTLASMIEKETGDPSERPLIASVFHNRLKKGMRLESDPTVIYGVDDYHGRIRYRHLRRVTPYNTYKIKGLPAGPIANPGAKALEAALYPADSDYLFFVSKNDTTHQFSTNLRDHNRAVKKYQLNR